MKRTGNHKGIAVEDDEDDYILTRGSATRRKGIAFQLDWFKSYQPRSGRHGSQSTRRLPAGLPTRRRRMA